MLSAPALTEAQIRARAPLAAHRFMDEESDVFPSTPPRQASQVPASLTPRLPSSQLSINQTAGHVMRSNTTYNYPRSSPPTSQDSTGHIGGTALDPLLQIQVPSRYAAAAALAPDTYGAISYTPTANALS